MKHYVSYNFLMVNTDLVLKNLVYYLILKSGLIDNKM